MSRWLRWALLTSAVAATTACSLLVGTDGLTTPSSSDGAPGDAGAGAESSASDASFVDAKGDAGVDAGGFCENRAARFCDDFEDEQRGLSRYSLTDDRGTVTRASVAGAPSPTHALACTTTSNTDAHVTAEVELGTGSGKITLAFALRVQGNPSGGNSEVGKIGLATPDLYSAIGLDVEDGVAVLVDRGYLSDGGSWYEATPTGTALGSGWVKVTVEVDYGATRRASLSIDGTVIASRPLDARVPASGSLSVELGLDHENVPLTAYFDDVVVLP